jgi:hypothetical protein
MIKIFIQYKFIQKIRKKTRYNNKSTIQTIENRENQN